MDNGESRIIAYTPRGYASSGNNLMLEDKANMIKRLNRIEGQIRGVSKMIDEDRYCIDVLQQMQAIKSALSKVEDAILKSHSATCVASAIKSGSKTEQQEKFAELVDLIGRYKRG